MTEHNTEQRTTLTDEDHGRWLVSTSAASTYLVDLDHRTIERVEGPARAVPLPSDTLQTLWSLDTCIVGASARWTIRNHGGYLGADTLWQYSSPVVAIVAAPKEDADD
ncbi:hypothetical protein [Leifsonia sp. NPDC058230]|uniref:hypothetical protein n=1 Tax=Leifsonia sp. NPDC058230 TaxID=3346391 RepID=UPI0036D8E0B9